MTGNNDNSYILVTSCKTFNEANSFVVTLHMQGYNARTWSDYEKNKYKICVCKSSCGKITLEDLLDSLISDGYTEAQIIKC